NTVAARYLFGQNFRIVQIAEGGFDRQARDVAPVAGRANQRAHLVAVGQQRPRPIGADEASRAGDEWPHQSPLTLRGSLMLLGPWNAVKKTCCQVANFNLPCSIGMVRLLPTTMERRCASALRRGQSENCGSLCL